MKGGSLSFLAFGPDMPVMISRYFFTDSQANSAPAIRLGGV